MNRKMKVWVAMLLGVCALGLLAAGGCKGQAAIRNIILACRALGLATLITTNHIRCGAG